MPSFSVSTAFFKRSWVSNGLKDSNDVTEKKKEKKKKESGELH